MQKYISEARLLLALAIPVILAQIAQTAMGFVDTVMAGGYSATDMAAVAIGTSIWLPAILFGHGLLLALTPVIGNDSNLLIVFYVQIMPDDFVMQLHRF
ncbi:hypothetical protein WP4S17E03_21930 [Escherichia coli]|nr:hypothetical protein WP4S17E03_21930 [Escherichia coli]